MDFVRESAISFGSKGVKRSQARRQIYRVVAWRNGNAFHPVNEVTLRRAGLVLGWVTACRQVNHLSM